MKHIFVRQKSVKRRKMTPDASDELHESIMGLEEFRVSCGPAAFL